MNKLAYQIGLRNSNFSNAHGLSDKSNKSNVNELGKLACIAIKQYPLIKEIGNTQEHEC
jgi:D-alanyl-D-alanine carboxypeptidase